MSQINDLKYAKINAAIPVGSRNGQIDSMELIWLKGLNAAVTADTVHDAWIQYLATQGFTSGSLHDRQFKWLEGLGYAGALDEKFYQYWGIL